MALSIQLLYDDTNKRETVIQLIKKIKEEYDVMLMGIGNSNSTIERFEWKVEDMKNVLRPDFNAPLIDEKELIRIERELPSREFYWGRFAVFPKGTPNDIHVTWNDPDRRIRHLDVESDSDEIPVALFREAFPLKSPLYVDLSVSDYSMWQFFGMPKYKRPYTKYELNMAQNIRSITELLFSLKARLALVYFYQDDLDETAALDEIYISQFCSVLTLVRFIEICTRSTINLGKIDENEVINIIANAIAPIDGLIRKNEYGILITEKVYMKECQWSGFIASAAEFTLPEYASEIFKKISASAQEFNEKSLWHRILIGLHIAGAVIKPDSKISDIENEILKRFETSDMAFYKLPEE